MEGLKMKIYYICQSNANSDKILKAYTDKNYALRVLRRLYRFMYLKLSRTHDSESINKYSELYRCCSMQYNFLPKWSNKKQRNCFDTSLYGTFYVNTLNVKEMKYGNN